MIEITNRKRFPVQLIVRSKSAPRAFTTLNIPGVGSGHNVVELEDERLIAEYADREKEMGFISTKYVNTLSKGE